MNPVRTASDADAPDQLSRGDRGARQSRRWLSSEIPLGTLLQTPYGEVPDEASPAGIRVRTHEVAPPGAALPAMPWTVTRKEQVWTPRLAHLVEQANASQWNATLDVPRSAAVGLSDHLESAVCDVFTWLLQQELVAHHVPSVWLPQIQPAFLEVKLFLSGKVMDEATRRIALLSRRDEARHVSYGVARLKHRLETARDPEAVGRQIVDWIAARIEISTEFFTPPGARPARARGARPRRRDRRQGARPRVPRRGERVPPLAARGSGCAAPSTAAAALVARVVIVTAPARDEERTSRAGARLPRHSWCLPHGSR